MMFSLVEEMRFQLKELGDRLLCTAGEWRQIVSSTVSLASRNQLRDQLLKLLSRITNYTQRNRLRRRDLPVGWSTG